jgi:hypothetical protein
VTDYTGVLTSDLPGNTTIKGLPVAPAVSGSSSAVSTITLGASPATYTATTKGTVNLAGGTVSQVALKRGGVSTNLGGVVGHFPVSTGDTLTITYSVVPTAVFVPL